jgi:hypothetical protein
MISVMSISSALNTAAHASQLQSKLQTEFRFQVRSRWTSSTQLQLCYPLSSQAWAVCVDSSTLVISRLGLKDINSIMRRANNSIIIAYIFLHIFSAIVAANAKTRPSEKDLLFQSDEFRQLNFEHRCLMQLEKS